MNDDFDILLHMIQDGKARDFINESNRIEGINREATAQEVNAHLRFTRLETVTVKDLERFVGVFQPGAKLRRKEGMNVRVGIMWHRREDQRLRRSLQSY